MRTIGSGVGVGLVVAAVCVGLGVTALAQRQGGGQRRPRPGGERFEVGGPIEGNVKYDGKLTFVRLSYQSWGGGGRNNYPPWSHDYPRGERHFMKILNEITLANPHFDESSVMALDDPELMKFPVAYMAEPGMWTMSEAEVAGLKAYMEKGGFLIFDDFRGNHWYNFELQVSRVYPKAKWIDLDTSHPIFHSFFDINSLDIIPQYYDSGKPIIRGLFEDNDPKKRLLIIANYNTDMSEYWEFSDTGIKSVDESNEAYKLGVNYFIYAITH